jgi:hypothetical protein
MFIVTKSLTLGQLTFILRASLQILSISGPFLIGIIILSHSPRFATFRTHDVLNRIVGNLSATNHSVRWIWQYIRQPERNPIRSLSLPISVALLLLYGLFSKLSDIGFLGFYTCPSPVTISSKYAYPNLIANDTIARSTMLSNMANGTDSSVLQVRRCDASVPIELAPNYTAWSCTAWNNSTWMDPKLFTGINKTDSDMLMPRKLAAHQNRTSFFVGTGHERIEETTISGGILVNPNENGFQAVFGVPPISSSQSFTLERAMSIELETGCMSLGINSNYVEGSSSGIDVFKTNGTWRRYAGPNILYEPLFNTTNAIREYWRPLFNESTLDGNGTIIASNMTAYRFTSTITVRSVHLPNIPGSLISGAEVEHWIKGNCTNYIRKMAGLPELNMTAYEEYSCGIFGLRGSVEWQGTVMGAEANMVCANTVQINMVSTTVQSDTKGSLSLKLNSIPSDLNYLYADYWEIRSGIGGNVARIFEPLQRFTLSENFQGSSSHYILQYSDFLSDRRHEGVASAGYAISRIASRVQTTSSYGDLDHKALEEIEGDSREILLDPTTLTRWSGQIGASYILASLQYNPWVALKQPPILVSSQESRPAICYHPIYLLGFLPLTLSALFVSIWTLLAVIGSSHARLRSLGDLYGGLHPYWIAICPKLRYQDIFLIWRKEPYAHLDVIVDGEIEPIEVNESNAIDYIASTQDNEVRNHLNV